MIKFYKLADPEAILPMPDRGGRAFSKEGQFIDPHSPFYRTTIMQGDLIESSPPDEASPELNSTGNADAAEGATSTGAVEGKNSKQPKKESDK